MHGSPGAQQLLGVSVLVHRTQTKHRLGSATGSIVPIVYGMPFLKAQVEQEQVSAGRQMMRSSRARQDYTHWNALTAAFLLGVSSAMRTRLPPHASVLARLHIPAWSSVHSWLLRLRFTGIKGEDCIRSSGLRSILIRRVLRRNPRVLRSGPSKGCD